MAQKITRSGIEMEIFSLVLYSIAIGIGKNALNGASMSVMARMGKDDIQKTS